MIAAVHNGLSPRQKFETLQGNYRARYEKLTEEEVEQLFVLTEELLHLQTAVPRAEDEDEDADEEDEEDEDADEDEDEADPHTPLEQACLDAYTYFAEELKSVNPDARLKARRVVVNLLPTAEFAAGVLVTFQLEQAYTVPGHDAPQGRSLLACPAALAPPHCVHEVPAGAWRGRCYSIQVLDENERPVYWLDRAEGKVCCA